MGQSYGAGVYGIVEAVIAKGGNFAKTTELDQEIENREGGDTTEATTRSTSDTNLTVDYNKLIAAEATARATAITSEATARNNSITNAIALEVNNRNAAILVETNARIAGDTAEVAARNAAITTAAETTATIKTKLGITTLSGSNTGDQVIPTTLPASDVYTWAKQSVKPTYSVTEITGLLTNGVGSHVLVDRLDTAVVGESVTGATISQTGTWAVRAIGRDGYNYDSTGQFVTGRWNVLLQRIA